MKVETVLLLSTIFTTLLHSYFAEIVDDDLFEGDITGVPHHISDVNNNANLDPREEIAFRWEYGRWPNGRIPYTISSEFTDAAIGLIELAMKEFRLKSCVRFIKRFNEGTYINIRKTSERSTCRSVIGFKNNGPRNVSLNNGCMKMNDIRHKLMHVLGFFHEHNRMDRDTYVIIKEENILQNKRKNFEKRTISNTTDLVTGYDFESIMHYPPDAFGHPPGLVTIVPKTPGVAIKADSLSKKDIYKINILYNFHNHIHHAEASTKSTRVKTHYISCQSLGGSCKQTDGTCQDEGKRRVLYDTECEKRYFPSRGIANEFCCVPLKKRMISCEDQGGTCKQTDGTCMEEGKRRVFWNYGCQK